MSVKLDYTDNWAIVGNRRYPRGSVIVGKDGTDKVYMENVNTGQMILAPMLATDLVDNTDTNFTDQGAVLDYTDANFSSSSTGSGTGGGLDAAGVRSTALTGFTTPDDYDPDNSAKQVTAADTVLSAFRKIWAYLTYLYYRILPGNYVFLSKLGVPDDADLSDGSTTLGSGNSTTDAIIQSAFDLALTHGAVKIWADVRCGIGTALKMHSNTTIKGLPGYSGFILRDGSDVWMMENANISTTDIAGNDNVDSNIHIQDLILNGNGNNQTRFNTNVQVMSIMGLFGVRNFTLKNVKFRRSAAYHVSVGNCENWTAEGCDVHEGPVAHDVSDGFHLCGINRDFKMLSCKSKTHDAAFVLSADDISYDGTGVTAAACIAAGGRPFPLTFGPIERFVIDDFYVSGDASMCGLMGQNLIQDGIIRKGRGSAKYATRFDNLLFNPSLMVHAGNGKMKNVVIEDIDIKVPAIFALSGGYDADHILSVSAENVTYRNIKRDTFFSPAQPTLLIHGNGGGKTFTNVVVDGLTISNDTVNYPKHILIDGGAVIADKLMVKNVSLIRAADGDDRLVELASSTANRVSFRDIYTLHSGAVLAYDADSEVDYIDAVGVTQDQQTEASFVRGSDVIDHLLTGYSGTIRTSGAGACASERGDGFTGDPMPAPSVFDPESISDLVDRWKADTGVTTDLNGVTGWTGSNGNVLLPLVGGQPGWDPGSGANNKARVIFSGAQSLGIASLSIPATPDLTVFAVIKNTGSSVAIAMELTDNINPPTTGGFNMDITGSTNTVQTTLYGNNDYAQSHTPMANSAWHYVRLSLWKSLGSNQAFVNVDSTTGNVTPTYSGTNTNDFATSAPFYLGSRANSSLFLTGQVCEVLIYGRKLTPTEIDNIEQGYIQQEYGPLP